MNDVLHGLAFALLVLIAFIAISARLKLALARSGNGPATYEPLDLYEAAYLKGGPRLVVDTALVSLLEQGGVRVSSEGIVTPVRGFRPRAGTPLERAVFRHVKAAPGGSTTAQVRHRTADGNEMRRLATPLWRRGLLVSPRDWERVRRRTGLLIVLAAAAAIVVVAGALLRASWVPLLVAAGAAIVGVACAFWLRRAMAAPVTRAGRTMLEQAETLGLAAGKWSISDGLKLMALQGLTGLPDRRLAGTLQRDTRVRYGPTATCCAPGHPGGSYAYAGGDQGFFGGFFNSGGSGYGGFGGDSGYGGGDFGGGSVYGGADFSGGGGDGGGGGCGGGGGGCGGGGS